MDKAEKNEDLLEPHQRDRVKESQILLWIWNVLEEIPMTDYDQFLKDGVILCQLMNAIKPGSIIGKVTSETLKDKRRNIDWFLLACQKYGVPKEMLFQTEDLLYLRHVPRVTRGIFALGKAVDEDDDYEGASLGEVPYEPVGKCGRRRGGLPLGDDIYVAHIKIDRITNMLPIEGRQRRESLKKRISLYGF